MKRVSREQLYEEVWAQPMNKACKKYGISDVGLRKICKKYNIPTPIQGHWAKLQHGKKVVKIKLPASKGPNLEMITIRGQQNDLSEFLSNSSEKSKILVDDIKISEELVPTVQLMKERLEKSKPNKEGIVSLKQKSSISISVKEEAVERTIEFVQRIIVIGKHSGVQLTQGSKNLAMEIDGEPLSFSIKAKIIKEPYRLTPQEQSKLSEWEIKDEWLKKHKPDELFFHKYDKPKFPKYTHHQSELLVFEIVDGQYSSIRRTFADGKVQRIEKMIGTILMTAKKHIAYRLFKRKEREEDEIRRTLISRLREEQTKFRNLEKKRVKVFEESFSTWKQYDEYQRFLYMAKQVSCDTSQHSSEWLAWAENYTDSFNPFREGIPKLPEMDDLSGWELASRY